MEEVKEILKEYNNDIKRHIDVLKEDFDSKVVLIGEQYISIQGKLDSHTEKLDFHTEMIGSMKVDIEIIKSDIEIIKNSLKKKVDIEDFEVLEGRVRILESKVK